MGVDRSDAKSCFACAIDNREADTLLPLIQKLIKAKTKIVSDGSEVYNGISVLPENYEHCSVNDPSFSEDPVALDHGKTTAEFWRLLYAPTKGGHSTVLNLVISESIFRWKFPRQSLFYALIVYISHLFKC